MAITVQKISLTTEKLNFLHYSVQANIYALIDVLGHFSVIFIKLNLPILLVLVGQREKLQKYSDLSAFN